MKPSALFSTIVGFLCLLVTGPITAGTAFAQDESPRSPIPEGVYLELTKDFYEALREDTGRSKTVYTNDPSAEHLKEIAVSARFMVRTNLEILKQQEEMIRLLRRLLEGK